MNSSTEALDYFPTEEQVEQIARALCGIDGINADQKVWMTGNDVATYAEAMHNVYPITMYGPRWLRFRRDSIRMAAAIRVMKAMETVS